MFRSRSELTARRFANATALAGLVLLAFVATQGGLSYVAEQPFAVLVLAGGVFLGELFPVRIPRRASVEEITISTSFSFALLLLAGLLPAVLAQAGASVVQDVAKRKPPWRIAFNVGQYILSLGAAWMTMRLLGGVAHLYSSHQVSAEELIAIVAGAGVFFVTNLVLVGTAVSLFVGTPVRTYLASDLAFSALMGMVLLCLAPMLVATVAFSPALVPLFACPMIATYLAGRQAALTEYEASHDSLTGLANRAYFRSASEAIFATEGHREWAVLLMDLDRFKEVNDTLGHHYGDLLLHEVGQRLVKVAPQARIIARLGGDEFAVLVPQALSEPSALSVGEHIAMALHEPFEVESCVVDVDASIGIANFPADGTDIDTLLQRGDVAMYHAKDRKLAVSSYNEEHDHHSPARLALMADLRQAIETDEIEVWYQPKIDLRSDEVDGFEALVRWRHPQHGLMAPNAFLEVAEHTSLIRPLTTRVLSDAIAQARAWRDTGRRLPVAVNVSARSLLDRDFPATVAALLTRFGVEPELLCLEVTESMVMIDPTVAQTTLHALHRQGVRLSIDDFGTGYSSLAYLARLPVHEVKIDRSFLLDIVGDHGKAAIVRATIDLGHHLGLRVVAEGLETAESIAYVRALDCDLGQGYFYAKPMPAPEAAAWLLGRSVVSSPTAAPQLQAVV
jgi:diguanylate cyclase (GGDEF)-like protein